MFVNGIEVYDNFIGTFFNYHFSGLSIGHKSKEYIVGNVLELLTGNAIEVDLIRGKWFIIIIHHTSDIFLCDEVAFIGIVTGYNDFISCPVSDDSGEGFIVEIATSTAIAIGEEKGEGGHCAVRGEAELQELGTVTESVGFKEFFFREINESIILSDDTPPG